MSQDEPRFAHRPVMVDEIVDLLGPVPPGILLDGTVGGGGHAAALLEAHPHLRLVGIDRDPEALAAARARLEPFGDRAVLRHATFDRFPEVLRQAGASAVSAVLLDLGVSSWQLDVPGRGFSYREDAPLDMRMDASDSTAPTAADIANTYSEEELAQLFAEHGETRFARRLARAVVEGRPLRTTTDLVDAVKRGIPAAARRRGGHPAKRVFQALRVEVNRELELLPATVDAAIDALAAGGRVAVLAYHSGEDRIVKARFASATTGDCTCPPQLPCGCGAPDRVTARAVVRGSRKPSAAETSKNPRAESARLRVIEKLPRPTTS